MQIYKTKSYEELSKKAAHVIAAEIMKKPDCVLGLATGSTPIGTYQQLVALYKEGVLDFTNVKSVNLDEYRGLPRENDQSYYYFMNDNLFQHININKENTNVPNGQVEDAKKECANYESIIAGYGAQDIQLLGIGHNGHIGFNEPCEEFIKDTHCVDLTESTIEANKRFFADIKDVPRQAYTMGIHTIMKAKRILVIASGADKAQIVKDAFFGPVTPQVPASILQLHSDVVLIVDEDAGKLI
ncbi:MAG: glucosamine-6-phosphate deaminase [Eubacteriales bacterium]